MGKTVKQKRKQSTVKKIENKTLKYGAVNVFLNSMLITIFAVILGLMYTGARAVSGIDKKAVVIPAAVVQPVETAAVVAPSPVPALAPLIPKEYRHLLKPVKTKEEMPKITLKEAKFLFDSGKAVFIDARGYNEYEQAHIKGAVSVPVGTPPDKIKE